MLNFNPAWRLNPPADDELHHGEIPWQAVEDFSQLIRAIAVGDFRRDIWEHFKRGFSGPARREFWRSTNAGFAEQDGLAYMQEAARNPPMFLEALYDCWTSLQQQRPQQIPPILDNINRLLAAHQIGYRVNPPTLEILGEAPALVEVAIPPATMAERARDVIRASLNSAAGHLENGDDRAAVMESLWLLDSITTLFSGMNLPQGQVNGNYFNTIVTDLRRLEVGGALPHALRWMETMYGYLSAPRGGQIRHGMHLSDDIQLNRNEARLYCNLIRSYIEYLLGEHERLTHGD
jgi:hypothetical protein